MGVVCASEACQRGLAELTGQARTTYEQRDPATWNAPQATWTDGAANAEHHDLATGAASPRPPAPTWPPPAPGPSPSPTSASAATPAPPPPPKPTPNSPRSAKNTSAGNTNTASNKPANPHSPEHAQAYHPPPGIRRDDGPRLSR